MTIRVCRSWARGLIMPGIVSKCRLYIRVLSLLNCMILGLLTFRGWSLFLSVQQAKLVYRSSSTRLTALVRRTVTHPTLRFPRRCGSCGGAGCGSFGGGPNAGLGRDFCCINPILANDEFCAADMPSAPCVICELDLKFTPRSGSERTRRNA